MAERRPKSHSLERVLGTSALFSTAYGNVGSSIYYALGLVAVLAAGLTPVVFGIGVVVVLGALNVVGVQESAKVNVVLSIADFLTQVLLVLVGLILVFN